MFHYIVTVDGKPTDIRGTSDLATRQAKIRKNHSPAAVVEIHYGEAQTVTRHMGDNGLQVLITAEVSPSTHLATLHS